MAEAHLLPKDNRHTMDPVTVSIQAVVGARRMCLRQNPGPVLVPIHTLTNRQAILMLIHAPRDHVLVDCHLALEARVRQYKLANTSRVILLTLGDCRILSKGLPLVCLRKSLRLNTRYHLSLGTVSEAHQKKQLSPDLICQGERKALEKPRHAILQQYRSLHRRQIDVVAIAISSPAKRQNDRCKIREADNASQLFGGRLARSTLLPALKAPDWVVPARCIGYPCGCHAARASALDIYSDHQPKEQT